jgi:hypothetical protein
MEARLEEEEPTSVGRKPEAAEQREVPVEDATVMPVREPEEEMTTITRKDATVARRRRDAFKKERTQIRLGTRRNVSPIPEG